jgi:hypothetical protein
LKMAGTAFGCGIITGLILGGVGNISFKLFYTLSL